jgi:hypothetical protein
MSARDLADIVLPKMREDPVYLLSDDARRAFLAESQASSQAK